MAGHGFELEMESRYVKTMGYAIPKKSYGILYLNAKSFLRYAESLKFSDYTEIMRAFNYTTMVLCTKMQGCVFGYTQSDEISILMADTNCEFLFGGDIQRTISHAASVATVRFYKMMKELLPDRIVGFVGKIHIVETPEEVCKYFIWRQMHATKRNIRIAALQSYTPEELRNQKTQTVLDLMYDVGLDWEECSPSFRSGRLIIKERISSLSHIGSHQTWNTFEAPFFRNNQKFLLDRIPKHQGQEK